MRHATEHTSQSPPVTYSRRGFLARSGRASFALTVLGGGGLLAACSSDDGDSTTAAPTDQAPVDQPTATPTPAPTATTPDARGDGTAVVGDVVDFALASQDWNGEFGWVTLKLHLGKVDGEDVYFIRTDASEVGYAQQMGLVSVPKLQALAGTDMVGQMYLADGDDPGAAVFTAHPGLDGFSPLWQLQRLTWDGEPQELTSVADVEAAVESGSLSVTETDIIVNAPMVTWPGGQLPVDEAKEATIGDGQLIAEPDLATMEVTFKLHQCFPNVRYILTDTALPPMAEGMSIAVSQATGGTSEAGATGRTNVFGNGLAGPGPMGFQPSVFDTQAGDPEWSPLWDHYTYMWVDGVEPRVLTTQAEVHAARDAGELEEFPGTPETGGEIFEVNCPVPVLASNDYQPPAG